MSTLNTALQTQSVTSQKVGSIASDIDIGVSNSYVLCYECAHHTS